MPQNIHGFTVNETAQHDITRDDLKTPEKLKEFGDLVLRAAIHRRDCFRTVATCVGYDATLRQGGVDDFMDPLQSLLYAGLLDFDKTWLDGNAWPQTAIQWAMALRPHYHRFFRENPSYPPEYIPKVLEYLVGLSKPIAPGEMDRVGDGLVDYVLGVRYNKAEFRLMYLDPAARREEIEKLHRSINVPGKEVVLLTPDMLIDSIFAAKVQTKPLYTGVSTFDYHYGRNAVGGDAWLAAGLSGGGKTNLATQTAGNTALHGERVLYMTTEVAPATLMMRACSAVTSISYASLRGLASTGLNHPSASEFMQWVRDGPGNRIQFFDYRKIAGRDYKEKLDRALESFVSEHGSIPDLIIWDWIGKALDAGYTDAWQKREAYNGVMNEMSDIADKLDNKTLTLAQADKSTRNKTNLGMSDTQDSKSLCDPVEGMICITALMEAGEQTSTDQDVYRENQYWVIAKCREENALRLAVVRDFAYARFRALS
jgi:hypothetical protein